LLATNPWLSCRRKDWATAASEPRCRCVYLHHGSDPFDPPNTRMWRDGLTITGQSKRAPPRIVLILVLVIPPSTPAGGTVGKERGVCGEFVLDIDSRSLVVCIIATNAAPRELFGDRTGMPVSAWTIAPHYNNCACSSAITSGIHVWGSEHSRGHSVGLIKFLCRDLH
jgi:hypothetical protein